MPCSGHCQNCKSAIEYVGCNELTQESETVKQAKNMIAAMEKRIDAYLTHPSISFEISKKLREGV